MQTTSEATKWNTERGEGRVKNSADILGELPRGRARVSFHHICDGVFSLLFPRAVEVNSAPSRPTQLG